MSFSKPLPPFVCDSLYYLNRDQLERFSIICHPLKNFIERYLHTKPYRIFDELYIRGGLYALAHNRVQWHPNRGDYSVQQFLAGQRCIIDKYIVPENDRVYYSFAEMRPYLGPTVRMEVVRIRVVGDITYNSDHIAEMESIAYLWCDANFLICNNNMKARIVAEDFLPILNSSTILQCRILYMCNAHFSFKDYKVLYSAKVFEIEYNDYGDDNIDPNYWLDFLEQPGDKPIIVLYGLSRQNIEKALDRLKQNHFLDSSMAGDINQEPHSSNEKPGSKTEEKRFKCDICLYSTKYKHVLLAHRCIHSGEKPFKCTQCSYASVYAQALKQHMCTHTGAKPYKCSHCSYAGTQLGNLKMHMLTHTGEKPHKCNQCSYASAQAINLTIHIRTHTGEKPYKCDNCSYICADPSSLKAHMRTHTGEKPYKCSQCSFASAQPGDLKKHIRIHTGEKPYKCSQCSYASAKGSSLREHMRTHTGEKPYKCTQCSYASARSSTLNTHMSTHI